MSPLSPLRRVVAYRAALGLLAARHLKLRYRRSVLGFVWTFAYPLLAMTVLTIVFRPVFRQVPDYGLYVLVGLLVWQFFSVSCLQAMDALLGSASVARKVYVPTAIFPLAAVTANLVNLTLCLTAIPLMVVGSGAAPGFHPFALLYGVALLAAFTAGVSLTLSALNVFFQDVRYLFEALLLVWFYATPIMYPVDGAASATAALVAVNPLHWILLVLRAALWSGDGVPLSAVIVGGLTACGALVGGWHAYCVAERRFHQYL